MLLHINLNPHTACRLMTDPPPPDSRSGKIVTFYSYKGGTGRSLALANVAWLLTANKYRVLNDRLGSLGGFGAAPLLPSFLTRSWITSRKREG